MAGTVTMVTPSAKATFSGVTISSLSVGVMARSHLHFLDAALHVEVPLRYAVVHAVEDLPEAAHRLRRGDLAVSANRAPLPDRATARPSRPVNTCAVVNG